MPDDPKKPTLRSTAWFGKQDREGFNHRAWMRNQGFPSHLFDGRPVIGICNTWSELTPCNAHFRRIADHVKRGVYEMGGFPLEFPVMSLGETLMRPTTMLYRNLASMDVEESIRANPLDGLVLLVGCDKTTPALMMGAASCDLPAIVVSGGPMLNGKFRGEEIGSGTDLWTMSEAVRAGTMELADFMDAEGCMSRSAGHCMTMGTASTMASLVEALGMGLPSNAAIPAVDARRYVLAHMAGRRAVELVRENVSMSRILTRQAFENAIRVNAAIGGSTNAIVHLLALAGRVGVPLDLEDFDRLGHRVPLIVNLRPSGRFLMEDFYYAGGLSAVLRELGRHASPGLADSHREDAGREQRRRAVLESRSHLHAGRALQENAGIAVLRGNLCPDGAVIKPSAATPSLMRHRGRAVVFESIEEFKAQINSPDLDVNETSVMVLKGAGPRGYPGFPEVGNLPLPRKVLQKGFTDMVRISDARMSGTAYGTVVLHVSPEAAVGGTLALVRNGDLIELDVPERRLNLDLPEAEIARRRAEWRAAPPQGDRGYVKLYVEHVTQAHLGCDLDFLVGKSGAKVPRPAH